MGLVARINNQRERQVRALASQHVGAGEEILRWVRVRPLRGRRAGFLYITDRRLVVHWAGEDDGHASILLKEIRAWGVDTDARGGPVLGVETPTDDLYLQMPALNPASAALATDFLECLVERAPKPRSELEAHKREGVFHSTRARLKIAHQKRSLADQTKRIAATVLGLILVVLGIISGFIPVLPGWILILFGLAILATEYDWARDVLVWAREKYARTKRSIQDRRSRDAT